MKLSWNIQVGAGGLREETKHYSPESKEEPTIRPKAGEVMWGPRCQVEQIGLDPKSNGEPLKAFGAQGWGQDWTY